jgi:large subunit ribosomal protein L5
MFNVIEQIAKIQPELKSTLGLKNTMAVPRLTKILVSTGVGKTNKDKRRMEIIVDRLAKITGQKPSPRGAKQSIASFKVRQGDVVGYLVTLRGKRMFAFLDKLLNIAFPRVRDFRGLDEKAIDQSGNMSLGIKEHTIFPETPDEEIKDVFSLNITLVTTAPDRKSALAYFRALGIPFKK